MNNPKFAPLARRTSPLPWKAPDPIPDREGAWARPKYRELPLIEVGQAFTVPVLEDLETKLVRAAVYETIRTYRHTKDGSGKDFTISEVEGGYHVLRVK